MERFTKPGVDEYVKCNINNACTGMCGSCPRNTEIRRLKYYEDLEEQEKLIIEGDNK